MVNYFIKLVQDIFMYFEVRIAEWKWKVNENDTKKPGDTQ